MSMIKFTCTQLNNSKKGILKPDQDGYYTMPVGGLNVFNSAGHYYTASGAKALFESSSQLMRRVKRGALRGEVGHPKQESNQSEDDYLLRILTIDERNVCAHFSELSLDFDNYKNNDGSPMVAIIAKVRPSGVKSEALKDAFDNPKENVCFSIRAFTSDNYKNGRLERTLKSVITFDWVNESGIHIAEKYKSTALESLQELHVTRSQLERTLKDTHNRVALENAVLTPQELFSSLGWSLDGTHPASSRW